jgi:hypothetical protein
MKRLSLALLACLATSVAGAAGATTPVVRGANGIFNSPVLNYSVPQTFDGTSLNLVSGEFNDAGPVSGDWDIDFWASSDELRFFVIDEYNVSVVVDGDGNAAVLQSGDTIGASSDFSDTGTTVTPSNEWLAGVDGYLGVKFDCDGRLANPVPSTVCFGYVHLTAGTETGFPATVVEYSYDGDGNDITIGPVVTFTVTPSVGTPSGSITPDVAQTVNSGATANFTLTPDSGFHIDNVGGTCGGTLNGSVYTTNAVTADCTVIANFAAGEPEPVISVTPSPLTFSLDAGATADDTLNVANTGGGTLTYTISEAATSKPTSYLTARRAHATKRGAVHPTTGSLSMAHAAMRSAKQDRGRTIVLGDTQISQMADNSLTDNTVACNLNDGTAVSDNSWWRRFYFSEHPEVGATASISSVTITSGNIDDAPAQDLPVTVNLYTIPHSTALDTIPVGSLTLIGSGTGTISGGFQAVDIVVSGTVDDTVGKDLVVEYHTDGNADLSGGTFFPGANLTPETHPTFISSEGCGLTDPTPTADVGFESHMPLIVTLGGGGPVTCDNPSDVPWLSVAPASGSLAGGASADSTVTVDASSLAAGSYSANLCVASNDTVTPVVTVPVSVTVNPVAPGDPCSAADTIFCNGFDPASGPFEQPIQDPSFEATTGDAGINPSWAGSDTNSDPPGGTPFYSTALGQAHTGDFAAWGGGWRTPGTQAWSQSVTISSGGPRYLNYWRFVAAAPVGPGTLTISVDGAAISTTDIEANGVDADWTSVSVDLSSFADDSAHTIEFDYTTTGSDDGNCFVDDITIDEIEGSHRR